MAALALRTGAERCSPQLAAPKRRVKTWWFLRMWRCKLALGWCKRQADVRKLVRSFPRSVKRKSEGEPVRKTGLIFVVIAVVLVVGSGSALAATIRCDGGRCEGTRDSD